MSRRNTVTPIVPRPAFEVLSGEDREKRVRIRTRGPFLATSPVELPADLQLFIGNLRQCSGGMPLTIVIAEADLLDPDNPSLSFRFFLALLPIIRHRVDAVWLLASTPPTGAAPPASVILDLTTELDRRIHENLVADILFLPAADAAELTELSRFEKRVSLLVVPSGAPQADALTKAATNLGITPIEWDPSQTTMHAASTSRLLITPEGAGAPQLTDEELGRIGERLAALAHQLTSRRERRHAFRQAIMRLVRDYELQPRWNEDLVGLADRFHWPPWAVEMLPKLYVRLSASEGDGRVPALVWKPIFAWIENYQQYIAGELCSGSFVRVNIPPKIDALLGELYAAIDAALQRNPYHGDDPFFGNISDAVDAVATSYAESAPDISKRLRHLSQQFVLPDDSLPSPGPE